MSIHSTWALPALFVVTVANAALAQAPDTQTPPVISSTTPSTTAAPLPKWEKEMRAFEVADAKTPPPQNAALFIGSSSITKWKPLAEDFPGVTVINRGFGGSQLADSVQFAPRIVWPYKPRLILLYAGDNDLAAGKKPEEVEADWLAFVKIVREKLPETRVALISIKPSPSRVTLKTKALETNARIKKWIDENPDSKTLYIDVWNAMLGENGKVREDIFIADRLHMNRKGYAIWIKIIAPILQQHMPPAAPAEAVR